MNYLNEIVVPFKINDMYMGFAECNGLIKFNGEFLIIEYEVADGIVNLVKSGIKNITIPIEQIIRIEYKKNLFISRIIISLKTLQGINELPLEKNELKLNIPRKYSEEASLFCSNINLKIAEKKLQSLDN